MKIGIGIRPAFSGGGGRGDVPGTRRLKAYDGNVDLDSGKVVLDPTKVRVDVKNGRFIDTSTDGKGLRDSLGR